MAGLFKPPGPPQPYRRARVRLALQPTTSERNHIVSSDDPPRSATALPQGDLRLLETDQARRLLAAPDVAVTIDTEAFPPQVLLLRGRAAITEADGVVPEYALAARRYLGEAAATGYLAQIDQPGTRMARIAVRPTWVGLLDFQTRVPAGFVQ
jgi:hypothetical protein